MKGWRKIHEEFNIVQLYVIAWYCEYTCKSSMHPQARAGKFFRQTQSHRVHKIQKQTGKLNPTEIICLGHLETLESLGIVHVSARIRFSLQKTAFLSSFHVFRIAFVLGFVIFCLGPMCSGPQWQQVALSVCKQTCLLFEQCLSQTNRRMTKWMALHWRDMWIMWWHEGDVLCWVHVIRPQPLHGAQDLNAGRTCLADCQFLCWNYGFGRMQSCCTVSCHSRPEILFAKPLAKCVLLSQYSSTQICCSSCSLINWVFILWARPQCLNFVLEPDCNTAIAAWLSCSNLESSVMYSAVEHWKVHLRTLSAPLPSLALQWNLVALMATGLDNMTPPFGSHTSPQMHCDLYIGKMAFRLVQSKACRTCSCVVLG